MGSFLSVSQSIGTNTIRRVAHPIDFSNPSRNGLSWTIHFAQEYDAEILLLHVIPPPTPLFELEAPIKSVTEIALSVLLAQLETSAIKARGFLLTGTSSTESQILRAAKLEHVDLIVMDAAQRNGLCSLFTRSLASRVMARADCPVVVVPSP
jgi:nucleotide-binding universal stress UspA family protein